MAHFYGTIDGNRGEASRLGSKDSGFRATAASWSGAISVTLSHCNGRDEARVEMTPWHGQGERATLYDGPVGEVASDAGWFVELVNADGDRLWSDVISGDLDRESLIESAIGFAECECASADIAAGSFRFYPIAPYAFAHCAKVEELA